jgi:hypothetical protein
MEKSAGYPYYYNSINKGDALKKFGDQIRCEVDKVLGGKRMWLPFTLTLKDELRPAEKVKANKTRGFNASGIVHLIASKMLFSRQNEKLVENIGKHPVTLGVTVPGPQFVRIVLRLRGNAYDADGDGCDQRFNLGIARVIRDVRKSFLPERYHAAVDHLYNCVYCGTTISQGVVYRMLHNKSGWECTGHDNSKYFWLALWDCVETLTGRDFDDVCCLDVNGDDLAFSIDDTSVGVVQVAKYLEQFNVLISYDVSFAREPKDLTFLSHHLRYREWRGMNMLIAAGNRPKLLSSLEWVQKSTSMSFEACCLVHLLGIRICLWAWPLDFYDVEDLIDDFLLELKRVKKMIPLDCEELMAARISEEQIASLHLKLETGLVFCPVSVEYGVEDLGKIVRHLIKTFSGNDPSEQNQETKRC